MALLTAWVLWCELLRKSENHVEALPTSQRSSTTMELSKPTPATESLALRRLRKRAVGELVAVAQALEMVDQATSITDHSNRIIYVNPAFLKLYGYDMDFILGKTPQLLIPRRFPDAKLREFYRCLKAGCWQGELENVDAAGRHFQYQLNARPLLLDGGQLLCYLGIGRRITPAPSSKSSVGCALDLLKLSRMERRVFEHLRFGAEAKEIAAELQLSHHTIATLKRRIYFKLGFASQSELFQFLLRQPVMQKKRSV